MDDSLIVAARSCRLIRRDLYDLGRRLPGDDEALAELLEEALVARDDLAFNALVLAALDAGRPVDAALLREGAVLLRDPGILARVVGHTSGDTASALLDAVRSDRMSWEREAASLFLAAWWCQHHGVDLPQGMIAEARVLARQPVGPEAGMLLAAAAELIGDDELLSVVARSCFAFPRSAIARLITEYSALAAGGVVDGLDAELDPLGEPGKTFRRAVTKISRNAPCPCGSGRKYKKCCEGKDRKRLRDSSEIPGVTRSELRERPEPYLTAERLYEMRTHQAVRLDPLLIEPKLHRLLLLKLIDHGEIQAVIDFFSRIGWSEGLDGFLLDAVETAVKRREHDLARQLMSLRPEGREVQAELTLCSRMVIAGLEPGPMLEVIERAALEGLSGDGGVDVAHSLLASSLPGLGILVGRGVVATAEDYDAEVLLDRVLETRDRLELSPIDPIEEVYDTLHSVWERGDELEPEELESGELDARQRELERAQDEVRRLRREVAQLSKAVRQATEQPAESRPEMVSVDEQAPAGTEMSGIREVRRRLAETREELKQRHTERNALRRELDKVRQEMAQMRDTASEGPKTPSDDNAEESLLVEEDTVTTAQPVRIPIIAPAFNEQLERLPRPVVRSAMRLIGRLAAGDLAGFNGARRLRLDRHLWRQRVGAYRLLFRLHDTELEVVRLIHRRDLERTAVRLAASKTSIHDRV